MIRYFKKIFFIFIVFFIFACGQKVEKVIDGDTFEISSGERVRLLGIDAPEVGQPGGDISRDVLSVLIEGKNVRLEKDFSDTDKYGRLLRYVYCGDIFVNQYMISQGYAKPFFLPPDTKYKEEFEKISEQAEINKRGLWGLGIFPVEIEEEPISWNKARQYIGQIKTVYGKVVRTYNSGKACFLNFSFNYKEDFSVVIFAKDFGKFQFPPQDYYKNKEIKVTGLIKEYEGAPEIIVSDPRQIKVLE